MRRRNAAEARERLLAAADELFAEHGFERTTIRALGQRAGVDPTLIARYFGGKAELYLTSIRRHHLADDSAIDLRDRATLCRALSRAGSGVPTPMLHAAVGRHADEELQRASMAELERCLIDPTATVLTALNATSARVRAQLAVAVLAGVVMSRAAGSFDELSSVRPAELARMVGKMIDSALDG